MIKFLIIFLITLLIINFLYAVSYLRRIAEALEDLVYDDEEEKEEVEVYL